MLNNLFRTPCYAVHVKIWQVNDNTAEQFTRIIKRHHAVGMTTENQVDGFVLFLTDDDRNAAYEELLFLLPFVALVQPLAYILKRDLRRIRRVYRKGEEQNERLRAREGLPPAE